MATAKKPETSDQDARIADRRAVLQLWAKHSDLVGLKVRVVGIVANPESGAAHRTVEIDMGEVAGILQKKGDDRNFNFYIGGKVNDPTETGSTMGTVFQVGANATACKSKHW